MPTKAELEEELESTKAKLREVRGQVRELKGSQSEHLSKTERTLVSVELSDDGSGSVSIDRDGHRVNRIDLMKEPV